MSASPAFASQVSRPQPPRLSQNSLAAVPPHRFIAKTAAERRQIVAGGASPRLAAKFDTAPEGRQKSLLFNRFLAPLRGSCAFCRDRGPRRCAARPRLLSLRPSGTRCFETVSPDGASFCRLQFHERRAPHGAHSVAHFHASLGALRRMRDCFTFRQQIAR